MFSYENYSELINAIKSSNRYRNLEEALVEDDFIIMRHDVEFSVKRAYNLAKLEKELNFYSNYFFQWTNNSYNLLSKPNISMIQEMHEDGHKIGLHFALNGLTDLKEIKKRIRYEIQALSSLLEFDIDAFSIHRPSKDVLRENIILPNVINAYQKELFTFAETINEHTELAVKYYSDARHKWNYGIPSTEEFEQYKKIQILTHPYSWTKEGYENADNFKTLIQEKHLELIETIDQECNHFGAIKEEIKAFFKE